MICQARGWVEQSASEQAHREGLASRNVREEKVMQKGQA